ncbi:TIGR02391 family protein [Pelagibius sp.]|uniref:TIGR02391 family protein n=1 Tax=Pelagibius sp. TaxID=1931238 RepID=UPI00260EC7D3|nr:TIGR02391 family protein [Pelagibius sp.]
MRKIDKPLNKLVPDVDVLLGLQPEELGGILLGYLVQAYPGSLRESGKFHPSSIAGEHVGFVRGPGYPQDRWDDVLVAIMEAFSWLRNQGLIALVQDLSDHSSGWHFVTRRGRNVGGKGEFKEYLRASSFPKELLHERISEKCWITFLRGDLDTSVFQAFKEVEIAVRDAAAFGQSVIGVDLMRKAFHVDTGPLTDTSKDKGERQALSDLFAGAIGSYKNPHSHRTVTITEQTEAIEMISLASHLLRIVDDRKQRCSP